MTPDSKLAELPRIPGWLRFGDSIARLLGQAGIGRLLLDANGIITGAERRCKLHDRSFAPALDAFCRAFDSDESLTFVGRRALRYMINDALRRRARVEQDLRANPQIGSIAIDRPIFVLGAPRTGTTLLQNLLLQDPDARGLRPWELEQPYPAGPSQWNDARRTRYEKHVDALRRQSTAINEIHPVDSPAECWKLLWSSFVCRTIFLFFGLGRAYEEWSQQLSDERVTDAYRFYRLQLQHLMWMEPRSHWVLKSPEHMVNLRQISDVFPDAVIVQLHRDPVEFVPSLCSLTYHCEYVSVRECAPKTLARQVMRAMAQWVEQNARNREEISRPVLDIDYSALIRNPTETVERIYEFAGRTLSADASRRIEAWLDANHRSRQSKHRYTLEQFGLTKQDVQREFQLSSDMQRQSKEASAG